MTQSAKETVKRAAAIVMIGMIVSRILGLVRNKAIAYYFGRGWETDAFLGAFFVPDLLYILSSGGALSAALIPMFSRLTGNGEEREAWRMASGVWNVMFKIIAVCIVLGIIFAPQLATVFMPGFRDEPRTFELCVTIMRIIFPMVIFTALAALCNGVLQARDHFTTPVLGWILHNFGIILAAMLLHDIAGIQGLAYGVLAGAFSMVAVQIPAMIKRGMRYDFRAGWGDPNVRRVLALFLPAMFGLSISQINLMLLPMSFGSMFLTGSVTSLYYAIRLMLLPMGVFGNALAMAAFPTLSRQAAAEDMAPFRDTLARGLRTTFVFSLPCTAGLLILGVPIVRMLFGGGRFSIHDCRDTAFVLNYFILGLTGHTIVQMISRGFYALQDTRMPFYAGLISVLLIIIPMDTALVLPFINMNNAALKALVYVCHVSPFYYAGLAAQSLRHGGVALSVTLAVLFNMGMLLYVFKRRMPQFQMRSVAVGFLRTCAATLIMSAVSYPMMLAMKRIDPIIVVFSNMAASVAVFLVAAKLLKIPEADDMVSMVVSRFKRK